MSGWLLLVGILVAAAVGWLIYLDWRSAQARRREAETEGRAGERRADVRDSEGRFADPVRPFLPRPVSDAELSSEDFVSPEVDAVGAGETGPRDGRPDAIRERGERPPIAVPTWEHPIPWSYGETRLVALARDPYWVFCYWELTDDRHRAAEEQVGREAWFHARCVIRVFDASGGGHYDIAVDEASRSWYVNVGQPDRLWYFELGRVTESGQFVMLARSNTILTPRDAPSEQIDWRWPPLRLAGFWPGGMPFSPGGLPASPGMRASETAGFGGEGGCGNGR